MRGFVLYIGLILCSLNFTFSQGEIDIQDKIFYRNERTFGILLTTNGLGVDYCYAKRINAYKKTIYHIDFCEIKHPKEPKYFRLLHSSANITYGKLNKFFSLRAGAGIQNEVYRKADQGSISIRKMFSGGISLGVQKPVYYYMYVIEPVGVPPQVTFKEEIKKFDTSPNAYNDIIKNASFLIGFKEMSVVPGVFLKYSMVFEYGRYDRIFQALEGGIIIDGYPRKIPLMAIKEPSHTILFEYVFASFYISYRFGRVIDSRFKTKKNKIDRILTE